MEKGGKMTEVMETYYEQILAFLTRACPHFALHQIKMQAIRSMAL